MNHGLLSTAWAFCTPCRFMEFEAEEEMQIQNTQLMILKATNYTVRCRYLIQ